MPDILTTRRRIQEKAAMDEHARQVKKARAEWEQSEGDYDGARDSYLAASDDAGKAFQHAATLDDSIVAEIYGSGDRAKLDSLKSDRENAYKRAGEASQKQADLGAKLKEARENAKAKRTAFLKWAND